MASSMTTTNSFFGGAVATKPATATIRSSSQLAVRASMDMEKVVAAAAETTNTRRGLVLAGMASVAASSLAKAATAEPKGGGYTPVKDPSAQEYFQLATFAVSEYNKQNKVSLTLETVLKVETQVVAGVNYKLFIIARDERPYITNKFEAIVYSQAAPTSLQLISFKPLLQ